MVRSTPISRYGAPPDQVPAETLRFSTMSTSARDPHAFAGELGEIDLHLFNEGKHAKLYEKLGAHPVRYGDQTGTSFRVWAPNADRVSVVGDWNGWQPRSHELHGSASGVWQGFVPNVGRGSAYKYHVESKVAGYRAEKADPLAFHCETPPRTASVVWDLHYPWSDDAWMSTRAARNALDAPIS